MNHTPPRKQELWRHTCWTPAAGGKPWLLTITAGQASPWLPQRISSITSSMVAKALGHGNSGITARHYATPGSGEGARGARLEEVLAQGAVILEADTIGHNLRELLYLI